MSNVRELRTLKVAAVEAHRQPAHERVLVGGTAMGATLARSGHHIRTEVDAEGVLDALECCRFDLVLLDLRAPEIDAITTVKLYRYIALGELQPPVVAVAERHSAADVNDCRGAGIATCMSPAEAVRAVAELTTPGVMASPAEEPGGVTVSDIAKHPRFRAATLHRGVINCGGLIPRMNSCKPRDRISRQLEQWRR
jgi:DNA-binding response OmpR family regulator